MKTTRYFREQIRRKRPYIDPDWCAEIIATPLRREEQPDGRVRFWGEVTCPGEAAPRVLRVVTWTLWDDPLCVLSIGDFARIQL